MAKSKVGALDAVAQYVRNKLPQTGFFSTLDELIAHAPFEKAPMDQWRSYLQPGRIFEREGVRFPLKKEEIDYANLGSPDLGTGTLHKEDLRSFLQSYRPDLRMSIGVEEGSNANMRIRPEEQIRHDMQMEGGDIDPRREPRLSLARYGDYAHAHELGKYEESRTRSPDVGAFPDHFDPDTISHSRTTVQPTVDDRLMRLIEEIQSDRHQAAADKIKTTPGGTFPVADAPASALGSEKELWDSIPETRRGYRSFAEEQELARLQDQIQSGNALAPDRVATYARKNQLFKKVPDAPFKTPEEYGGLELRQQLLNAAKDNQDYLGLVRGQDVSQRFSQSKEAAAGTSHVYDKVYRSQLEKLARQYGSMVDDVPTSVKGSIDYATPTMRDVDAETTRDFLGGAQDIIESGNHGAGLDQIRRVISELSDHPGVDQRFSARAVGSLDQFERHYIGSPHEAFDKDADVMSWWNQLQDDMGELHQNYIDALNKESGPTTSKSFPAMILTPEIRAKILKAGVPIWALGATGAVGSMMQDDNTPGFAEGGNLEDLIRGKKKQGTTPDLDWIKNSAAEFKDRTPGSETRNRRMMEGFASQWYGIDADGNVRFMGGDPASFVVPKSMLKAYREMMGTQQPETYGPGMLDELRSLFGSKDASDRLAELHKRIQDKLGLEDPHGFQENFDESLGVMGGQLPIPVRIPPMLKLAKTAPVADRLYQLGKRVISPAAEWLSPTIDPSAANYLTGSTFGGGVGALADALAPDQPKLKPLEKAEGGSIKASVKPLREMLDNLQSRFDELTPGLRIASPAGMLAAPIARSAPMDEDEGYAEGGKVKTLLELREALMRGPNVEGTGKELQALKDKVTQTGNVPAVSTPDTIREMVSNPPPGQTASDPLTVSRRSFLQGASSLMTPVGGIPLNAEAALAALVKKQLAKGIVDEPLDPRGARDHLEDLLNSREDEDYNPDDYLDILDQYPEHGPGIHSAMMAVKNFLDKHGDSIWDDPNIENQLIGLGQQREAKIGELARHLGYEPNPGVDTGIENSFEYGHAIPEDPDLRHSSFVPAGTKFIAPKESDPLDSWGDGE